MTAQTPESVGLGPAIKRHGFAIFAAFFVAVFALGGGSRADILSVPVLRALAAAWLVIALMCAPVDARRDARWPLRGLALCAIIIALQLVPLPYALWSGLPGRAVVVESFAAAGLTQQPWMPLSLAPFAGWNSLLSLIVPAGALLCGAQLSRGHGVRQIGLLLAIICASAVLAIFQVIGPQHGPFYLYRITNADSAVGLFANRNHQALLLACGFPLIAAWVTLARGAEHRVRAIQWGGAIAAAALVPLIIVTGSRGGLILGAMGLVCAALLYRRPISDFHVRKAGMPIKQQRLIGALVIAAIVGLTLFTARTTAIDRIGQKTFSEEDRVQMVPTLLDMAADTLPLGAGAGSFVPLFKIYEPDALLSPNYYNHAHNDALEILIEFGVFGALFLVAIIGGWLVLGVRVVRAVRAQHRLAGAAPVEKGRARGHDSAAILGMAGMGITAMCLAGSVLDYPLRVPSIAALAALATLWMIRATRVAGHARG
ncbi:MAG: O-antigen ligase family protein [Sphingopyxis sp.]